MFRNTLHLEGENMTTEAKPERIWNFQWHIPGLLATGGKPYLPQHLTWLQDQGIKAIVSLDPIPDQTLRAITLAQIPWFGIDLDDYEERKNDFEIRLVPRVVIEEFYEFVQLNISLERPVLVHCGAGIKRSVQMTKMIVRQIVIPCKH